MLTAGAAKVRIDLPPNLFPIDGFDGVLDPLFARVLVFADGDRRVGIAVLDQTSLVGDLPWELATEVASAADLPVEDVLVIASHTFSAPHVGVAHDAEAGEREFALRAAVFDAVRAAAAEAHDSTAPAALGFGLANCAVNINRDVPGPSGSWLGANEDGQTDPTVAALRVDDADGSPLAVVINYAVQSSILDASTSTGGRRLVSADLAGAASAHVEAHLDGAVALFIPAACGDQSPIFMASRHIVDRDGRASRVDLHDAGYALVELLGERLGEAALRAREAATEMRTSAPLQTGRYSIELESQQPVVPLSELHPRLQHDYRPGGAAEVPFWIQLIGDVAIVGVQPELSSTTGIWIRENSPFGSIVVASMVNGAAKYLPDASSYPSFTYEAMSSRFAAGGAERLADAIVSALWELADARVAALNRASQHLTER